MFEAMRHRAAGGHLDLLAEFYEFKFLIALEKSISQYILVSRFTSDLLSQIIVCN